MTVIVRGWEDESKGRVVVRQRGRTSPGQYLMEDMPAVFYVTFSPRRFPVPSEFLYIGPDWNEAERIFTEKVMELKT